MSESFEEIRSRFIELIGLVTQAEGLPRISGRIFGLLIFDGRPYSFSELATELQVSRGSISSNARMLVERGAIEKVAKPGDRQDYFQVSDDPFESILTGVSQRAAKTSKDIRKIAGALPKSSSDAQRRLERYAAFYAAISEGIRRAAEEASGL